MQRNASRQVFFLFYKVFIFWSVSIQYVGEQHMQFLIFTCETCDNSQVSAI